MNISTFECLVQMWPDLIKKAKDGGVDAIETYVFWNAHEPFRRHYDFSGNLDLISFIKTIQDHGMYAVLRIGPYVCAEWNYGYLCIFLAQFLMPIYPSYLDELECICLFINIRCLLINVTCRGFPLWLHNMRGIDILRTTNTVYMVILYDLT